MSNQKASLACQLNLPFDSLSSGKERGKLYQNKSWLYQKYWTEDLNSVQIAKLANTQSNVIMRWLRRYEIPTRSRAEANKKSGEKRKKESRRIKKCKNCGKKLWAYKSGIGRQHFCNNKCRYKFMVGKNAPHPWSQVKRNCEICGKEFYISNYKAKQSIGRFCSRKCTVKWRSETWIGHKNPNYKPKSHKKYKCSYCNKAFEAKIDKRNYKNHYCSRECKDKDLIKNVIKKCLSCGKKVLLKPFEIKNFKNMILCSEKCRREYKLKNFTIFLTEKIRKIYLSNGKISRYCSTCGNNFYIKLSDLKYNRGIYCSKLCTSIGMKKLWSNPEYAKSTLKAQMKGANVKPTKPERIFNENTPSNINYVGNGKFFLSFKNGIHKNPDFKVEGQRKVIEIFGDYWHRNDNPQELIDLYNQIGFQCLVIWENEVYNKKDKILKQVDEFIHI